jgi:hypothetical protein
MHVESAWVSTTPAPSSWDTHRLPTLELAAPSIANGWKSEDAVDLPPDEGPPIVAPASEFIGQSAAHNSGWQGEDQTPAWGGESAAAPSWGAPPSAWEAATDPALTALPIPSLPETPSVILPGEHRVVLHTLEGGVKRGVANDIDLAADSVALSPAPGQPATEIIAFSRAKALFFMLQPGEKPQAATGRRVKVTFVDGRQVEGVLGEEIAQGFFLLPVETRTSTARVYVLSHAVRSVV